MLSLSKLSRLVKKRKRVGRGGSRGGTSGRGHKGQKARSGGSVRIGFEGGQMPLLRRLPKRGFRNVRFEKKYIAVGLDRIAQLFGTDTDVTPSLLIEKGVVSPEKSLKGRKGLRIKVLSGKLVIPKGLTITAHAFSKSALKMIEKSNGTVLILEES